MNTRVALASALLALASTVQAFQDAPAAAAAPPEAQSASTGSFAQDQLEQIAGPIALYPDELLAQVLMAATYPLEIVEAQRWLDKNPGLTGVQLDDALKGEDWDDSVKSLCTFPEVVKKMSDNLDWTKDLGDAFLGQKEELFAAIQMLRGKAQDAGSLKSNDQTEVSEQGDTIVIESTSPDVIYVPSYSPAVVYGPGWYYPYWYYRPLYPYPGPGGGIIAWGIGVAWIGWGICNWHDHDIDIDVDVKHEFNRKTNKNPSSKAGGKTGAREKFQHDPQHRKGVNYKDSKVAQKFDAPRAVSRDEARGFNRGASAPRAAGGATRPTQPTTRPAQKPAPPSKPAQSPRPSTGQSALSGSRSPGADRASSTRGASSRARSAPRGGGGRRGR